MDHTTLVEYEVFKKVNSMSENHSGNNDTYTNYGDQDQNKNGKKFTIRIKMKNHWLNLLKKYWNTSKVQIFCFMT